MVRRIDVVLKRYQRSDAAYEIAAAFLDNDDDVYIRFFGTHSRQLALSRSSGSNARGPLPSEGQGGWGYVRIDYFHEEKHDS